MKNRFRIQPGSLYSFKDRLEYIPVVKEQNYKLIIENLIHAFLLTLSDGSIIETNKAASDLFGYTAAEFKKLKKTDIIELSDPGNSSAHQTDGCNNHQLMEATCIKKNRSRFPVEFSTTSFIDLNGITKCSIIITDISERKKTESALKLSIKRYNLVVKATKDLVWDWDLVSGNIYRNGQNLTAVYGHSSNKYINNIKDWSAYIHPEDKDRIRSLIDYYINSPEESSFNFEYRFRREDGSYVYINDKGYIIRNREGKALRMIGAAEDITERIQVAQSIIESEQRYKLFLQQSSEGIWRIELKKPIPVSVPVDKMLEYCYQYAYLAECNDAFAKMYGFETAGEIIGSPISLMLPATNPVNIAYMEKFFCSGFKVSEELSYEIDKDGNELIFTNNMIGIVEGEYLIRAWGTQRNVTDQKKAERDLTERENHLKAIVNADPECIKLMSKEGIILEMNPAGLEMIGAENADQVLGKNAFQLVSPMYHEIFRESLEGVFDGKSSKVEFEIIGFHKKRLFMESQCVPLRNASGSIIAALAVTRDITENKNAQAQLQASRERYMYLFNNNPASIIIWDIDTLEIIEANETTIEIYGYSTGDFLSLSILDLYPGHLQSEFRESLDFIKQEDTKKVRYIWQHITKDEIAVTMEITSHKIKYKGRNAVLAVGTNITEKTLLEQIISEEREIKQQQITEAVIMGQEKERIEIGEDLHDNINQILASTKLYIECALKDENPRKELIIESKALVEKAMKEIRNLSKSLLPPSLGEVGLLPAVTELVDSIKHVYDLNISIYWKIKNDKSITDKLKLTIFRIIQEQLNNIIKHANAGNVIINISDAEMKLEMSIQDDGLGFDTSLKRNGVGLRNIKSRAEVNEGKVELISSPGNGCELVVSFPLPAALDKL